MREEPEISAKTLQDEDYFKLVCALALDVKARPVPPEVLLAALLDQQGHYVSDKIVELMEVAGVAPCPGVALVTRAHQPVVMLPPGFTRRTAGEHAAFFYEEGGAYPWVGHCGMRPSDAEILLPCEIACARWGAYDEHRQRICYPWEVGFQPPVPRSRHGLRLASLFLKGRVEGVVAVAAGRLDEDILAIVSARWMLPTDQR